MKIAIAGTGYVGLVTAVCLAHWGHQVTCVEMDEQKLALLSCGKSPIFETGVETLLQSCAERLSFTNDYQRAYRDAQILFICVGTPERGDGYANLKYVYAAALTNCGLGAKRLRRGCQIHRAHLGPAINWNGCLRTRLQVKASR
jgi:UDPglucose 6-dehydrogenase